MLTEVKAHMKGTSENMQKDINKTIADNLNMRMEQYDRVT